MRDHYSNAPLADRPPAQGRGGIRSLSLTVYAMRGLGEIRLVVLSMPQSVELLTLFVVGQRQAGVIREAGVFAADLSTWVG